MQKVFENVIKKLNEAGGCDASCDYDKGWDEAIEEAIKIVKQEADRYDNDWIPCSSGKLPNVGERVLLQDFGGNITLEKCEKKKRIKGFTDGNWWASANNYLAWQPLPEKYQPKGE